MNRFGRLGISIRSFSQHSSSREQLQKKIEALAASAPLTHQSFAGRKRFYKFVGVKTIDHDKVSFEVNRILPHLTHLF